MKKIAILLTSLAIVIGCGGGGENKEPGGGGGGGQTTTPTITIPSTVNKNPVMGTEGGSVNITFTASDNWTASVINTRAAGWVGVTPASGSKGNGSITITAQPNDTPDERGATIQIKCGTATQNIVLTQKQKDSFTASASKTEIGKDGGAFTIEVKANVSFEYTIDSGSDWITYKGTKALKTSTLTFEAAKNEDTAKREGQITVKSSAGQEVFKIYQEGGTPTIVISTHNVSMEDTGGSFQIEVRHNVDVTVTVQDGITWMRENKTKAMSTNTFNFTVDANEGTDSREGDIYFTNNANGLSEAVHVIQAQKNAIVIAKNSYEVSSDGGEITVKVSHNVNFNTEISANWISIKPANTKAMVDDYITFVIEPNESGAERTGTIIFKAGSLQQTVSVKQLYTAPDPSWTKPGFFGVEGFNWEYNNLTDQIMFKGAINSDFSFALIKPGTNKILMITFACYEDPFVGQARGSWIMQNIDDSKPSIIEYVQLVITKMEGDYIWLRPSSTSDKYIIVKYK